MNPLVIALAVAALSAPGLAAAYQSDSAAAAQPLGPVAPVAVTGLASTARVDLDNGQNAAPALAPPYHHWNRGQTLPMAYRAAPIADYASHHLRQPPYGYQWYLCGDQMVLAAVDSGMIFEVIEGE